MKNKNYYPFERNHYFYGKLLTVRDFELEQKYFNNKRRILNRLMHGVGVVAGLDVVHLDDQSISVEAGLALDFYGREIVVQEPATKKLHMLDGFDQVKNSPQAYLCIEYDEQLAEPVHSVASTPRETSESDQYNRIAETYRLFLTDESLPPEVITYHKLYQDKKILFKNEKLTVEQLVPKYVRQGEKLDLTVHITKRGSTDPVGLQYQLETEHLTDGKGEKSLSVSFQEKDNKSELKLQQNYTLDASQVKKTTDRLTVSQESFRLILGEEEFALDQDFSFQVQVIEEPLEERLLADYYSQDFSELISAGQQARIYLAKLHLITTDQMYLIEFLDKMPYQQYVLNNELLWLMMQTRDLRNGNGKESLPTAGLEEKIHHVMAEHLTKDENQETAWTTGVEEIDLGIENTRNRRFYSNEIAHGLGTGPVALLFALEDVYNILDDTEDSVLIFGENSVFDKTFYETGLPDYRIGALAYPNRGTFRIGVHLLDTLNADALKIRWWAYKHPGEGLKEAGLLEMSKIKVTVIPDTVTLSPREKAHFTAQIDGTNYQECRWSVKEEKGGQIDHNGVYEAPNHEGVFEVIAESVKYPEKKGSAFVVVKG